MDELEDDSTNPIRNFVTDDPDIESLLMILGTYVIPIATCMYQVAVQKRRYQIEDSRKVQEYIQEIEESLGTAQNALDELEKIVRDHNIYKESIFPVGNHSVGLNGDVERYKIMVVGVVSALRTVDNAGMKLSNYSLRSNRAPILKELECLQKILNKVYTSTTYGDKIRYIRWSIKQSYNILFLVKKTFGI
jgi:prefoldin subunit 5